MQPVFVATVPLQTSLAATDVDQPESEPDWLKLADESVAGADAEILFPLVGIAAFRFQISIVMEHAAPAVPPPEISTRLIVPVSGPLPGKKPLSPASAEVPPFQSRLIAWEVVEGADAANCVHVFTAEQYQTVLSEVRPNIWSTAQVPGKETPVLIISVDVPAPWKSITPLTIDRGPV